MQIIAAKRPRKRKRVFRFNVGKHTMLTFANLVPTMLSNPDIGDDELRDYLLSDRSPEYVAVVRDV